MVLLSIFLLAGLDQAINPKSRQTIGKRVRLGFTDAEFKRLTTPFGPEGKQSLRVRRRRDKKKREVSITF